MPKSLYIPVIDNGMGLSRTGWAVSMCGMFMSRMFDGWDIEMQSISYPYPDGAMNLCTNEFMETGKERMLLIDTDEAFKPMDVALLLSHNLPFVSGIYPKKKPGMEFPIVPLDGRSCMELLAPDAPPLVEVARCARGFMAVRREVFEEMAPHVPEYDDPESGKRYHQFWQPLAGGHSEDYRFCDEYRAIGGKIWIDRRVAVQHIGSAVYPIKETYDRASFDAVNAA